MKTKWFRLLTLAIVFMLLITSVPGCSKEPEKKEYTMEERTRARAIQLAKQVIDIYIDKEIYDYDGEIYVFDSYNPWTKETEGEASVWHYTALLAMTNRLADVSTGEDEEYFTKWCDEMWVEMDWYKGSGVVTTYNSSTKRTMYAVNRAFVRNTANISGINAVYDDQMWILREFISSYQRTGNKDYLQQAEELMATCLDGWDTTINPATGAEFGGITWGPGYDSKHTCSNAPLVSPLVDLYYIYKDTDPAKAENYLEWAKKIYDFTYATFKKSNDLYGDLIGTSAGYNEDNLRETYSHGTLDISEYTYNTGAMIQGGAKLYKATGQKSYLTQAQNSAEAADRVFSHTDPETGLNEYVTSHATMWFNLELLLGYIDLAQVDDSQYNDVNKGYIDNFRESLDYAYDNYYVDGVLPRALINGWAYGLEYDMKKNVMDSAAAAEMYAMLYQYYMSLEN